MASKPPFLIGSRRASGSRGKKARSETSRDSLPSRGDQRGLVHREPKRRDSNLPSSPSPVPPAEKIETLLLSGGGYRAAAFHLGVLRWLFEHCPASGAKSYLRDVHRVVGVSGGSMTAAHFACHADQYCDDFVAASGELVNFLKSERIRHEILTRNAAVADLVSPLCDKKSLSDPLAVVDGKPVELVVLGTCMKTGYCTSFSKQGITRYRFADAAGNLVVDHHSDANSLKWQHAIQASAAFPPVFVPLVLRAELINQPTPKALLGVLADTPIVDGGVRDNLGIEYALSQPWNTPRPHVLVSDAGRIFDWSDKEYAVQHILTWFSRFQRVVDIQMNRLASLDQARSAGFAVVSMARADKAQDSEIADVEPYRQPLTRPVATIAADFPTDLEPFTNAQFYAIVRLGYDCVGQEKRFHRSVLAKGSEDSFWEDLFPKEHTSLSKADDHHSIIVRLQQEKTSVFEDFHDIIDYLPPPVGPLTRRLLRLLLSRSGRFAIAMSLACACTVMFLSGHYAEAIYDTVVPPETEITKVIPEPDNRTIKCEGTYRKGLEPGQELWLAVETEYNAVTKYYLKEGTVEINGSKWKGSVEHTFQQLRPAGEVVRVVLLLCENSEQVKQKDKYFATNKPKGEFPGLNYPIAKWLASKGFAEHTEVADH